MLDLRKGFGRVFDLRKEFGRVFDLKKEFGLVFDLRKDFGHVFDAMREFDRMFDSRKEMATFDRPWVIFFLSLRSVCNYISNMKLTSDKGDQRAYRYFDILIYC